MRVHIIKCRLIFFNNCDEMFIIDHCRWVLSYFGQAAFGSTCKKDIPLNQSMVCSYHVSFGQRQRFQPHPIP